MPKTIQVTNCLTCPFFRGGMTTDYECTHDDGPEGDVVAQAAHKFPGPTIAEGCPLEDGATLVQLKSR